MYFKSIRCFFKLLKLLFSEDNKEEEVNVHTDEDLSIGVDSMLTDMDINNDGYIDWIEYSSFTFKDNNAPVESKDSTDENDVIHKDTISIS